MRIYYVSGERGVRGRGEGGGEGLEGVRVEKGGLILHTTFAPPSNTHIIVMHAPPQHTHTPPHTPTPLHTPPHTHTSHTSHTHTQESSFLEELKGKLHHSEERAAQLEATNRHLSHTLTEVKDKYYQSVAEVR